jgi:hypothetical protein
MGNSLSFGAWRLGKRHHAIAQYFRFGMDGLAVE